MKPSPRAAAFGYLHAQLHTSILHRLRACGGLCSQRLKFILPTRAWPTMLSDAFPTRSHPTGLHSAAPALPLQLLSAARHERSRHRSAANEAPTGDLGAIARWRRHKRVRTACLHHHERRLLACVLCAICPATSSTQVSLQLRSSTSCLLQAEMGWLEPVSWRWTTSSDPAKPSWSLYLTPPLGAAKTTMYRLGFILNSQARSWVHSNDGRLALSAQ
eukprot:4775103-Pleurochrysis_carterae.AAC.1